MWFMNMKNIPNLDIEVQDQVCDVEIPDISMQREEDVGVA